jgi:acyl-CoA synthetase (AMP-forming)/AMP-acid ligase II
MGLRARRATSPTAEASITPEQPWRRPAAWTGSGVLGHHGGDQGRWSDQRSDGSTVTEFNLAAVQEALGSRLGDREAIVSPLRRVSWAELTDRTRRLANVFVDASLGVRAERHQLAPYECGQDRVAIYLHNRPEYLEAMLGAFKARLAPCNVNYRYVEDELARLFADMAPGAIVFEDRFAERLGRVLDRVPMRPLLLQVGGGSEAPLLEGALPYEEALAQASPKRPDLAWSPDDLYVLYTGGTTGPPKGVLWRQADIFVVALGGRNFKQGGREWRSLDELAETVASRPGIRAVSAAPFMHGTGQWISFQALHSGGTVVIPSVVDRFDASSVLDAIEQERANLLVIAGEAFARPLLDALAERPRDLSSLLAISTSGAALAPQSKAALLSYLPQVRIRDTVGSSESGPQAEIVSRGEDPGTTRFRPIDDTCVVDESRTRRLPPGHDGIGWLARSGRIPLGYLGDADRTAATFPVVEGVRMVVAGDRARLLADGTIELLGREAAVINSGGEKIFAEEVEAAVRQHPGVRDVLVVGRPSPRWGSEVVALVQPDDGAVLDADAVVRTCATTLARYKLPKAVIVVDQVRRMPSGKPDYAWARRVAGSTQPDG